MVIPRSLFELGLPKTMLHPLDPDPLAVELPAAPPLLDVPPDPLPALPPVEDLPPVPTAPPDPWAPPVPFELPPVA